MMASMKIVFWGVMPTSLLDQFLQNVGTVYQTTQGHIPEDSSLQKILSSSVIYLLSATSAK
jgi:hypothetical protein